MSNAAMQQFEIALTDAQYRSTTDRLIDLIDTAAEVTKQARRRGHYRLMRTARHVGEQLQATQRQLGTVYDRQSLDAASALIVVSRGYLDAITEAIDLVESDRSATTTERIHAVEVISQRRAAEPHRLTLITR